MTRIALVTPMLPVPHDQTRGRYIYETAMSLSRIANVRVFFMQQRYPGWLRGAARHALHGLVSNDFRIQGLDMETFSYPAVPLLTRSINGHIGSHVLLPRLRAYKPDIVLAYWVYPDGYAALRAARALDVPCIVGALGSDIHVRTGHNARMTRHTIAGVDALLTVSEDMRQAAIAEYGADPQRVHTIINGFNTTVFRVRSRAEARAKLGLTGTAKIVLYVGRLVHTKGLRELQQAYAAMRASGQDVRLVVVGDGLMRDELAAWASSAPMQAHVTLTGGLEPAQVATWIAAADVLTLPSWSEGYPNVVVEAVACGRPVVATDVGGTREIVNASNGLLIAPRDVAVLQAALTQALQREWDAADIAATLRRSWDDVARDTLAVCEDVVQQRITQGPLGQGQ